VLTLDELAELDGLIGRDVGELLYDYALTAAQTSAWAGLFYFAARQSGPGADAQAVYKTLDPVMLEVLTNPNANISQLLSTATSQVNQILANSG